MGEACENDEFKLENVSLEFDSCFEGRNIRMDKFIDAYTELIRWGLGSKSLNVFLLPDVKNHAHLSTDGTCDNDTYFFSW